MADALDSKSSTRKGVRVRLPPLVLLVVRPAVRPLGSPILPQPPIRTTGGQINGSNLTAIPYIFTFAGRR